MNYAEKLARIALDIGAIKINPGKPFTWASGYRMPFYNDNRLLLGDAAHRLLVAEGLQALVRERKIPVDVVAGTATAGIPPATTLANLLQTPLIYVRGSAKTHGLQNQIEGILRAGQKTVVVEDLVSTGDSVLKTVAAIRAAGGIVEHCLCIFSYGFESAEVPFQQAHCGLHALLTYKTLIDYARNNGVITDAQASLLDDWFADPFSWGGRHGFPKQKKVN